MSPKETTEKPKRTRSPEAIAKAKATRARNAAAKAKAAAAGDPVAEKPKPANGRRRRGMQQFKLYANEGNELAFLIEESGPDAAEAVRLATQTKRIQPGIPVVALPVAVLEPHVVEEVQQEPLYVLHSEKKRGRPKKAAVQEPEPSTEPTAEESIVEPPAAGPAPNPFAT